jgi:hypothetical protein
MTRPRTRSDPTRDLVDEWTEFMALAADRSRAVLGHRPQAVGQLDDRLGALARQRTLTDLDALWLLAALRRRQLSLDRYRALVEGRPTLDPKGDAA